MPGAMGGGGGRGCRGDAQGIWGAVVEGCKGEVQWEMPVGVVQRDGGVPGGMQGEWGVGERRQDGLGSVPADRRGAVGGGGGSGWPPRGVWGATWGAEPGDA